MIITITTVRRGISRSNPFCAASKMAPRRVRHAAFAFLLFFRVDDPTTCGQRHRSAVRLGTAAIEGGDSMRGTCFVCITEAYHQRPECHRAKAPTSSGCVMPSARSDAARDETNFSPAPASTLQRKKFTSVDLSRRFAIRRNQLSPARLAEHANLYVFAWITRPGPGRHRSFSTNQRLHMRKLAFTNRKQNLSHRGYGFSLLSHTLANHTTTLLRPTLWDRLTSSWVYKYRYIYMYLFIYTLIW